jgi:nitronate monooxygenase
LTVAEHDPSQVRDATTLPQIIQGGMGVGVSTWRLANAVSSRRQLGVVSGTGLDTVFVRRLQDGDDGGHLRRASEHFPLPDIARDVLRRYYLPEGRQGAPYKVLPVYRLSSSAARERLTMLASFVEVFLAKEGHDGPVGINLLTKIQLPTLSSLYGAMLAGVDVVLMGAGIPREIPAALDALAEHEPASLRFDVEGDAPDATELMQLDPRAHLVPPLPSLRRPTFLAIIASSSLAKVLARKASGRVDGFVIEGPTAGGHNAPPRGEKTFNDRGEPLYGIRDVVDLGKVKELDLPFWLAGGFGAPGRLQEALAAGAAGIQVGTLFAFCDESGLTADLKASVLSHAVRGSVDVFTDPLASPTGFPFKTVRWAEDPATGIERQRVCDLGYLRNAYRTPTGDLGYRCAAEPVDAYVQKGGSAAETQGRACLCNALMADIGLGQVRSNGVVEQPLVTTGDGLTQVADLLAGRSHYSAADVIDYLRTGNGAESTD